MFKARFIFVTQFLVLTSFAQEGPSDQASGKQLSENDKQSQYKLLEPSAAMINTVGQPKDVLKSIDSAHHSLPRSTHKWPKSKIVVPEKSEKKQAYQEKEKYCPYAKPAKKSVDKKHEPIFIYDTYTARRGTPKMLEIFCAGCDKHIMSYQKDGPGALLRCYLDRIHSPKALKNKQYDNIANLTCLSCSRIIGTPMIYKPENRPAYRMIQRSFYFKTNC